MFLITQVHGHIRPVNGPCKHNDVVNGSRELRGYRVNLHAVHPVIMIQASKWSYPNFGLSLELLSELPKMRLKVAIKLLSIFLESRRKFTKFSTILSIISKIRNKIRNKIGESYDIKNPLYLYRSMHWKVKIRGDYLFVLLSQPTQGIKILKVN